MRSYQVGQMDQRMQASWTILQRSAACRLRKTVLPSQETCRTGCCDWRQMVRQRRAKSRLDSDLESD